MMHKKISLIVISVVRFVLILINSWYSWGWRNVRTRSTPTLTTAAIAKMLQRHHPLSSVTAKHITLMIPTRSDDHTWLKCRLTVMEGWNNKKLIINVEGSAFYFRLCEMANKFYIVVCLNTLTYIGGLLIYVWYNLGNTDWQGFMLVWLPVSNAVSILTELAITFCAVSASDKIIDIMIQKEVFKIMTSSTNANRVENAKEILNIRNEADTGLHYLEKTSVSETLESVVDNISHTIRTQVGVLMVLVTVVIWLLTLENKQDAHQGVIDAMSITLVAGWLAVMGLSTVAYYNVSTVNNKMHFILSENYTGEDTYKFSSMYEMLWRTRGKPKTMKCVKVTAEYIHDENTV